MSTIIDSLIYDRTQADVDRWKELEQKGFSAMSAEDQGEWLAGMKGSYNAIDRDRVDNAVDYLVGLLVGWGYSVFLPARTYWTGMDIPTKLQFTEYFIRIAAVRSVLAMPSTTPYPTISARNMTYQMANDIEKILVDVEDVINTMISTLPLCGEAICGGDYL